MMETRYTVKTKGNCTTVTRIPAPGHENLPIGTWLPLPEGRKPTARRGPVRTLKPKRKTKR